MRAFLDRMAVNFARRNTVAISDCVHFCGYRYGRNEVNPYEHFAIGLAEGRPLEEIRNGFVDYLKHYRPDDLGQALGIELSRSYPLWYLPWRTPRQVAAIAGWQRDPEKILDVMTYFSSAGIPRAGLEREFSWHERAFESIRTLGYLPATYGYIIVRELRKKNITRYLVTDGNHRISALSALGYTSAHVKTIHGTMINADEPDLWPLVRMGIVTLDDALLIFNAYLSGNRQPMRSVLPANII